MKVKALILSLSFLFVFSFSSCDEDGNLDLTKLFTESDNAGGLKEALKVGTSNASKLLGAEDGYLKDQAVKILLPENAQTTFKALDAAIDIIVGNDIVKLAVESILDVDIVGGVQNTLEIAFNRAAEEAAPAAVDVFVNTITNMTISDATGILFSSNNQAATDYLHTNSYTGLQSAFNPIINESMKTVSVTIGSTPYNAIDAWEYFAGYNNKLAVVISSSTVKNAIDLAKTLRALSDSQIATINSVKTIDTNLGDYVVGKALDGIFIKVGVEEHKIRTDVSARTTDILKDVFGQLDKQ